MIPLSRSLHCSSKRPTKRTLSKWKPNGCGRDAVALSAGKIKSDAEYFVLEG